MLAAIAVARRCAGHFTPLLTRTQESWLIVAPPIRLLAMLVAALVVCPVGAETLVVSAARMLDAKPLKTWKFCAPPQRALQNCDVLHALCQLMSLARALCLPAVMIETPAWRRLGLGEKPSAG